MRTEENRNPKRALQGKWKRKTPRGRPRKDGRGNWKTGNKELAESGVDRNVWRRKLKKSGYSATRVAVVSLCL